MSKDLTGRMGLVLTWETADHTRFWHAYKQHVAPILAKAHNERDISLVLPYEHKPLNRPGPETASWTNCAVVLIEARRDPKECSTKIIAAARTGELADCFRAADLMCVQRGIDMVYAARNGLTRERNFTQMIEYVFSKPERRAGYYEDQYIWSGPVMRELHSKDLVGRFLGFEMHQRIAASPSMSEWDVLHLVAATPWQMFKAMPRFFPTWNRHAKNIWGPEMTFKKKVAEWDKIRLNIKSSAKQKSKFTLQAPAANLSLFL